MFKLTANISERVAELLMALEAFMAMGPEGARQTFRLKTTQNCHWNTQKHVVVEDTVPKGQTPISNHCQGPLDHKPGRATLL